MIHPFRPVPRVTLAWLAGVIVRGLYQEAKRMVRAIVPTIIVLALLVSLAAFASYEARYTDASGARCATFHVGAREIDLCTGRDDRPVNPAWVSYQASR